jgi:hypothetical protein
MKKYLVLLAMAGLLVACKHKRASLTGNGKVEKEDFMESFPDLQLPYQVGDTILDRDEPDSTLMGYRAFTQFVPDTVLGKHFSKGTSPQIYPLGKVKAGKNETYLFLKAVTPAKEWVYIICLDKADHYVAARPLFTSPGDKGASSMASLDSRYTLTVMHQRRTPGGETFYKKDSYIFNNDAGKFMLILTESNEAAAKNRAVINPIDTFPRKHKFSGEYVQDKLNFISVRDGRDASHIVFFVHFEKDDGDCKGELKGEAKLISPTVAHYTATGDPCSVNFSFTPVHVTMKELEGCGNHRDIKCFFEGVFARQKELKKKVATKSGSRKVRKSDR